MSRIEDNMWEQKGFRIIDDLVAEIAAQTADTAEYSEGITIEAVIPGEHFADVSCAEYQDPGFVAIFDDLLGCRTLREKAVRLGEYLKVYPNTDHADVAALQVLRQLNPETAADFLYELRAAAPNRNWVSSMLYVLEAV